MSVMAWIVCTVSLLGLGCHVALPFSMLRAPVRPPRSETDPNAHRRRTRRQR